MKKITVLGSTGSIGKNTLDIISNFPDKFRVVGLSAYNNIDLLRKQVKEFSPRSVAIKTENVGDLKTALKTPVKIFDAASGLAQMVSSNNTDLVVMAISGSSALESLLEAIRHKKAVALANKEALVMAGSIVMKEAKKHKTEIIPIDSEQSAIFQCLQDREKKELKRIYLTASGGPLDALSREKFKNITVKDVLRHPRWKMGKKVTVDSATLMNKGLELIEAMWLFGVDIDKIKVLIHKEAIVHSMVEFVDGSIIAQLGVTDMKLPIQYALTYPQRLNSNLKPLDFDKLNLTFKEPDLEKFPCLKLAYKAASMRGTATCVLNAANEEAVEAFLKEKITYLDIYKIIKTVLAKHRLIKDPSLNQIKAADIWARKQARKLIYN